MIISIFLVQYLYSKNLNTHLTIPILKIVMPLAALIFVDNTDLYVFNSGSETTEEIILKAQHLLDA